MHNRYPTAMLKCRGACIPTLSLGQAHDENSSNRRDNGEMLAVDGSKSEPYKTHNLSEANI